MQTIYVSNHGSDENDGKTRATPVYSWRRVNALCEGSNEIHLIEGDATLIRLKTEIDDFDRRAAVKSNPFPAHLSDYNQGERASIIDEMKSILGYRDFASPPYEEVLNLTEESAASAESDEEVLELTEELIPRQTQDATLHADVSANTAADASEGLLTDFIGDIERRIEEALAPLRNENHEGILVRTEELNPAQVLPDDGPLILEPDRTSAEQADVTASAWNSSTAAAAKGSLTEFQIEAKTIGEIQRQIAAALAPLKDNSCDTDEEVLELREELTPAEAQMDNSGVRTTARAAEGSLEIQRQIAETLALLKDNSCDADDEVLNLTEELIPGQKQSDDSCFLAGTELENAIQAHVSANATRSLSTATRAAEGPLPESDIETNLDIQRRITEALAPLKNRSRYEGDEEVLHLTEAVIPGQEDDLSPEPEPEK